MPMAGAMDAAAGPPPSKRQRHEPGPAAELNTAPVPATGSCAGREAADAEDDDALLEALPNDVMAALLLIAGQFPKQNKVAVLPFALRTQLYTILSDRTAVDRQLDEMRLRNAVRVFQLPGGGNEVAVVPTAAYTAAILALGGAPPPGPLPAAGAAPSSSPGAREVLDWFVRRVLPSCCEASITHGALLGLLPAGTQGAPGAAAAGEAYLSILLREGVLTRAVASGSAPDRGGGSYLFALPHAGAAVRSVADGGAEVLGMLRRRQQRQMSEREALKRPLRRSVLGLRWHLRHLLGSGAIERVETTVGPILRLPRRLR